MWIDVELTIAFVYYFVRLHVVYDSLVIFYITFYLYVMTLVLLEETPTRHCVVFVAAKIEHGSASIAFEMVDVAIFFFGELAGGAELAIH
jgi:hypothetical protein